MGIPWQQGKQQHREVQMVVPVIKSDADACLLPVEPNKIMRSSVRITAPCHGDVKIITVRIDTFYVHIS